MVRVPRRGWRAVHATYSTCSARSQSDASNPMQVHPANHTHTRTGATTGTSSLPPRDMARGGKAGVGEPVTRTSLSPAPGRGPPVRGRAGMQRNYGARTRYSRHATRSGTRATPAHAAAPRRACERATPAAGAAAATNAKCASAPVTATPVNRAPPRTTGGPALVAQWSVARHGARGRGPHARALAVRAGSAVGTPASDGRNLTRARLQGPCGEPGVWRV